MKGFLGGVWPNKSRDVGDDFSSRNRGAQSLRHSGCVPRHPSGQGFTTSSVIAFSKAMHDQLSSLKQKYDNLELQHAEDVEGLKEEHELEMDNMQTQVSNAEAECGEWQEKYSKAVLSHSDCCQVKNEYDRLIGEEKEYIKARAEAVGLCKQLEHAEETRHSTEQELDYLKVNLSPDAAELIELRALVEHQKSIIADDLISENQSQEASDLLALYKQENDLLLNLGSQLFSTATSTPIECQSPRLSTCRYLR
ncbi:hypothetical protein TI39_contig4128g00001 [Zymoseptoria brevis]|uniref:Uncharacterized protein n=1 Tax=Zymoseptoria brevis TaxID=1047168 RepID=A0A0F4GG64_9PEZI|nr:hypothetical protein TI39_contig4128g00001 [Zymoseptoria brevis]